MSTQLKSTLDQLGARFDANETAHVARALESVKSRTYDRLYAALKVRSFIPVTNETDEGADSIVYQQWDEVGMAEVITNHADDPPMVDVISKEFSAPVKSIGVAFTYSIQDLRRARLAGSSLDARRAQAARNAFERKVDLIGSYGVAAYNLPGFLNNANVPVVALPNAGAMSGGAAIGVDLIFENLGFLAQSIVDATCEVHEPDTLLLPSKVYGHIARTFVDTTNRSTILSVFLETNPYIRNVDQWKRLETVAEAAPDFRAVAYMRDPMVLELEIPKEFEMLPPQPHNYAIKVPCHGRIGGVQMYYPLAVAYADFTAS